MNLWNWPALSGLSPRAESRFFCQRGIYGKVDNANTDFRWIAASGGFTRSRKELHKRFSASQSVLNIPLWWQFEGRYYASFCYRSAGRDAAGRSFVETQILEWEASRESPVALAAIALVPGAAAAPLVDWSAWGQDPNWMEAGYVRAIPTVQVKFTAAELEQAAERGLVILRDFGKRALQEFYQAMLSHRAPALITGLVQPLPPEALAALLLPFRPDECGTFSLAGWETEHIYWSGMACNRTPAGRSIESEGRLLPEHQDRAAMMAKAICANDPELAAKPCDAVRAILAFARDPRERFIESNRLPRTEARIIAAEAEILEMALLELASLKPSEYLQKAEVQEAFLLQMASKAEVVKAWWLVAAPPEDIRQWLEEHPPAGTVTVRMVLSQWKEHPLAARMLLQLDRGAASTISSIP